jgi:hypothetical protein
MDRTLMTARPTLLLAALGLALASFAQGRCTAQEITERWLQAQGKHIDLAQEVAHMQGPTLRGGGLVTVPVAVHVVYNTPAENVPTATIMEIIDQMNLDYQALNADYGNARPDFLNARGNAGITFCLAVMDPDGNATTGITRTSTAQAWFDPDTQTDDMKSAPDGIAPWDPFHYLNIWICDISSGATGGLVTAGYAYLPYGGVVGSPIDGLVLDYSYGTGVGDRTATHEVGHYLGLLHPWGDGGCGSTDGVDDTPVTDSPTYSCSNTGLIKCSVLTQYENFMDYSNCTMMFTIDQVAVMSAILNSSRSELLNGNGCSGTEPPGGCLPTSANGTSDGDFLDGVSLGEIDNTGSGSTGGPAYHDYTAQSAILARGDSYTLQATSGAYGEDVLAAWIDMDGNGIFDADELLGADTSSSAYQTMAFPFIVPDAAALGTTVMRVRCYFPDTSVPAENNGPDACVDFSWGETEDYGITITSATGIPELPADRLAVQRSGNAVRIQWRQQAKDQRLLVIDGAGRILIDAAPRNTSFTLPISHLAVGPYEVMVLLDGQRQVARFSIP